MSAPIARDGIRRFRLEDLPRLREICVLTGAAGGDATGRWSSDDLLPDLFLEPYLTYAPDWAWVVDVGAGPVGYLVSVPDTRRFVAWWRAKWAPWFGARYTRPVPPYSPEEELVERGFEPQILLMPELHEFPAHLHIDLLPEAQGKGHGRALIETLVDALAGDDIPGVHLTMDPANVGARLFYARVGFTELESSTRESPAFGRRTGPVTA
jgi:ribosomal protein S18 acetylase RimI-like enzyme